MLSPVSEKSYTFSREFLVIRFYTNTLLVFVKENRVKALFSYIQQIFQTVNRAKALYLEKYYFIHSQIISLLACDRI